MCIRDSIEEACDLTPSTMSGTGSVEGNVLVIPAPEYTCDDGSEPQALSGPTLNVEEGIHFHWHLLARGRGDVAVELFDEQGRPEQRCELPASRQRERPEDWAMTGVPKPPPGGPWALRQSFRQDYWAGRRHYECYLWGHD